MVEGYTNVGGNLVSNEAAARVGLAPPSSNPGQSARNILSGAQIGVGNITSSTPRTSSNIPSSGSSSGRNPLSGSQVGYTQITSSTPRGQAVIVPNQPGARENISTAIGNINARLGGQQYVQTVQTPSGYIVYQNPRTNYNPALSAEVQSSLSGLRTSGYIAPNVQMTTPNGPLSSTQLSAPLIFSREFAVTNPGQSSVLYNTPVTSRLESREEQIVRQTRAENPFRDVPFFGEASTTALSGFKMGALNILGTDQRTNPIEQITGVSTYRQAANVLGITPNTLPAGVYGASGTGQLFLGGYTIGSGIGAAAGTSAPTIGARLLPFGIGIARSTAAGLGFEAGFKSLSDVTSGKPIDLSPVFTPSNIVNTAFLGTGAEVAGIRTSTTLARSGSAALQQVGGAAAAGAVFGSGAATVSSENRKPIAQGALIGGVVGGGLGGLGYLGELSGRRVTVGRTLVDVINPETGKISQQTTGFKFGLESISPKTGEAKFYGLGFGGDVKVPEGTILRPTGVFEAQRYTPQLTDVYKGEAKAYFANNKINFGEVGKNVEKVFGVESPKVLGAITESRGILGGSTVEKAIETPKGLISSMKSARRLSGSDVDVVGYFDEALPYRIANRLGPEAKVTAKSNPLSYEGYPQSTSKYEVSYRGNKLDITIMNPTPFEPAAPTPLGQFGTSYSLSRSGDIVTYSPKTQIASKFATIGVDAGTIKTIEPGKSKYLQDIGSILESTGRSNPFRTSSSTTSLPSSSYVSLGSFGSFIPSGGSTSLSSFSRSTIPSTSSSSSFSPSTSSSFLPSSFTRSLSSSRSSSGSSTSPSSSFPSLELPSSSSISKALESSSISKSSSSSPSSSRSPSSGSFSFSPGYVLGGLGGLPFGLGSEKGTTSRGTKGSNVASVRDLLSISTATVLKPTRSRSGLSVNNLLSLR